MSQTLAHTTIEQRLPLYKDLRQLLVPGFLTQKLSLNGVIVGLRSLSARDYLLMRYRGEDESRERISWVIAQSLWIFDGQVILGEEPTTVDLMRMIQDLPLAVMGELVRAIIAFQNRVDLAIKRAPAFFYEEDSRHLWRIYGAEIANRTGIPGAASLGLNVIQQMWMAFNVVEDAWEQWRSDWIHTKLIASTQSPKGVKKLNEQDDQQIREEKARRQAVWDSMYYESIGLAGEIAISPARSRFGDKSDIKAAYTAEELEEEMHKVRLGIKDDHDEIVDAYKNKIVERIEAQKEEARRRMEEAQKAAEGAGFTDTALRPLMMSQGEVEERLETARGRKQKTVYFSSKANSLYQRYLQTKVGVGRIHKGPDGAPVAVPDLDLNEKVKGNG